MQQQSSQTGEALQRTALVQITDERCCTRRTPFGGLRGIAQQRENAVMADKQGQGTAGNIAAANNK